ncbi:MAG: hypothetical protein HKM05_06495 [Spirochaetales bacterium]|nr:hypothetical protein [Spirochaetales bacterium]
MYAVDDVTKQGLAALPNLATQTVTTNGNISLLNNAEATITGAYSVSGTNGSAVTQFHFNCVLSNYFDVVSGYVINGSMTISGTETAVPSASNGSTLTFTELGILSATGGQTLSLDPTLTYNLTQSAVFTGTRTGTITVNGTVYDASQTL